MIARSWSECRSLYEADEKTWRLSLAERARDWANGRCGQCGNTYDDHQPLAEVSTAAAVVATPYPPVDPLVIGYLQGVATRAQLGEEKWQKLCDLLHLIPDEYPVKTGGAR